MTRVLLLAALVAVASAAAPGYAAAQTTVDQMTCAQAVRSAAVSHRYYKRTSFGIVPIMPVFPFAPRTTCLWTEWAVPQVERTRDSPACAIGYKCEERDPTWIR
ncbi:MAG: hypothetical protein U1E62_05710 [Alsobacter sp.]